MEWLGWGGKLAKLQQGNEVPPTAATSWTDLDEILEFGGLDLSKEIYDTSTLDGTIWSDQIVGRIAPFNVDLTCLYNDDVAAGSKYAGWDTLLRQADQAAGLQWFKIVYPDTSETMFSARVARINNMIAVDDKMTYELTLAVTGSVTRTAIP